MSTHLHIRRRVKLARLTTLKLGGAAEYFVAAESAKVAVDALDWATQRRMPVTVLGGGSNLVVADEGVPGLVLHMRERGRAYRITGGILHVTAAAGESWDELAAWAVRRDLQGIECLSGIPGTVGASPIQNIGAYGQEVAKCVDSVIAYDRVARRTVKLDREACGFAYRDSVFKRDSERWLVLRVTFALKVHGAPALDYAALREALPEGAASLRDVRHTVLNLRRAKSMVLQAEGDNRRSAGCFFTNPVITEREAQQVAQRVDALGLNANAMPRWVSGGGVKLSAGWLIERAGMSRGLRQGRVGISSDHALALVHHGGGTTRDLLQLASRIQTRVREVFGVALTPEPALAGFAESPLAATA